MAKIIVYLGEQEREALQQLAQREMRVPRAQAALIIRRELTRLGMLPEQEYRIVNTTFGDVYLELGMNGIVVATIGSHLGLPDLFDTETGRTAIGRFGLMDGQSIFSYLGVFPPEPSAWEKQYLGWVNPIVINTGGTYSTKAASLDVNGNESVYKILISGKEYFLVENRNRDANNDNQKIYFVNQNGTRDSMTFTKDEDGFNSADIWKLKGSITDVDELDWSVPGLKNDTANFQGGILVWHIDENVIDGIFLYRLKQTNFDGTFEYSNTIEVEISIPTRFSLNQNFPNPFNPVTSIQYAIANKQFVTLKVYDILGKEITTLVNENKEAGNYSIDFNAAELPSGVYIYQLTTPGFIQARKMILAK